MSRTLRFHLDETCPAAIADGLRRRGIDVTTTSRRATPSRSIGQIIAGLTQIWETMEPEEMRNWPVYL